jgi:hypothetical protein
MQITVPVTLTMHLLAGVFWAGSTFTLARTAAASADRLFWPQIAAAVGAIITGGYLWYLLHSGFGAPEQVLALGALCATLAIGAQAALCGPPLQQLKRYKSGHLQARVTLGHRVAAGLLAATIVCMAVARYIWTRLDNERRIRGGEAMQVRVSQPGSGQRPADVDETKRKRRLTVSYDLCRSRHRCPC